MSAIDHLHAAWRRIPPRLRGGIYEFVTERAAAGTAGSGEVPAACSPPYVVVGPLSAPTGLGQAARLLVLGLRAAGRPVSLVDLSPALRQPSVVPLPRLPAPAEGPGTLIIAAQPPTVAHCLALVGRRILRGKRRVGFWAWELDVLPDVWRRQQHFVHEVATPSVFCAEIFRKSFTVPVGHVPFPLAVQSAASVTRSAAAVVFGCAFDLGSTAARKNPMAVVDSFRRAFGAGDAVRLAVRVRDPESEPEAFAALSDAIAGSAAPIELLGLQAGERDVDAWWASIDVFVSLHRSEGFGLMVAEAMQRGIPVIATDWSATREFVSRDVGWPVPARIVPALDATGRYSLGGARWADPDRDAAAAAMQAAAADTGLRRRKGEAARGRIEADYSVARFVEALESRPSV